MKAKTNNGQIFTDYKDALTSLKTTEENMRKAEYAKNYQNLLADDYMI
jgi:hypothetical protein